MRCSEREIALALLTQLINFRCARRNLGAERAI
jgi:hypothetical protein